MSSPKSSIISGVVPRLRSVSDSVLHHYNRKDDEEGDSIDGMKEESGGVTRRWLAAVMVMVAGTAAASR